MRHSTRWVRSSEIAYERVNGANQTVLASANSIVRNRRKLKDRGENEIDIHTLTTLVPPAPDPFSSVVVFFDLIPNH